jgi:hypothetical protein
MRTIILISVLIASCLLTLGGNVISGNSNTPLENYCLTQVDDTHFNLTYSNAESSFTIEICKGDDECCYLLRGESIEIMYLCNENGFGMRKMPEKLQKLDVNKYKHSINHDAFGQQSLLSPNRKDKKEALGIIACFFPNSINSDAYETVFNLKVPLEKEQLSQVSN